MNGDSGRLTATSGLSASTSSWAGEGDRFGRGGEAGSGAGTLSLCSLVAFFCGCAFDFDFDFDFDVDVDVGFGFGFGFGVCFLVPRAFKKMGASFSSSLAGSEDRDDSESDMVARDGKRVGIN